MQKGITIISLVITIIVLLILAGVSIATLTGDNGIITQASNAKEQSEISGEKEIIEQAIIQAMGKNRYGDLMKNELEEQINKLANQKVEVYTLEENYIIYFEKSKRVYSTDNEGNNIELRDLETLKLAKYIEEIILAYDQAKKVSSENTEIFEQIKQKLNYEGANYTIGSVSMIISTKDGFDFTILEDGTVLSGIFAYLNIADGSIDLKANGYIQNNEPLVEYNGKYIITGTTTENVIRVMEIGKYDVTIRDLDIKLSEDKGNYCAFNANRNGITTECYVNITLEGENYLYGSGNAAGLGFAGATPNVDGVTNGSTLTIQGEGSLEAKGAFYAAGIGSGYSGWDSAGGEASNIIINSGNIKATGGTHGAGIGGGLHKTANNIIINGGNIEAVGNSYGPAIGTSTGAVDNIVINGGNIKAIGGNIGPVIGSRRDSNSGTINITGGNIYTSGSTSKTYAYAIIGHGCESVKIEGGTIRTYSTVHAGIYGEANVEITGGNLLLNGLGDIGTLDENKNFVKTIATNGESDIYLTKIKLANAKGNEKVTELKTSDNIAYGIKDMYVAEDDENTTDIDETGMIYLYLPKGSRTITLKVDGKNYSGTVETTEEGNIVTLSVK